MSHAGAAGGAGAAAAAAAIANAIKASGVLIRLEPLEFERILRRCEAPLIVTWEGGFFSKAYRYLTSYRGLAFHAKARVPLDLPATAELIRAEQFQIPG